MTDPLPAAVVFDCDGTLVDTEPISDRTWLDVLPRYGYEPTAADRAAILGRPWKRSYEHFADRVAGLPPSAELRAEIRAAFRERFDREVEFFVDVVEVLRTLAAADVPIAVASSSSREHVERVLARAGIAELVAAVVGADDCDRHKPEPEPYLRAAAAIGADPAATSAVEDSAVGVHAAKAAGMWVVALRRPGIPDADLAVADRVVDELTVADLVPPRDARPPR